MPTCRSTIWSFALSTIVTLGTIPIAAEEAKFDVDLQLILAVDVSDSMRSRRARASTEGYASTFRDPNVARAISSGEIGRIAVLFMEWAGPDHLYVVRPWTILATPQDASAFADTLAMEPIAPHASMSGRAMSFGKSLDQAPIATATATSISAGLLFAREQFSRPALSRQPSGDRCFGERDQQRRSAPLAPVRDLLLSEGDHDQRASHSMVGGGQRNSRDIVREAPCWSATTRRV